MKELNRREFLTLSGAAVVALSLAGCGGGPSVPPAPTTSGGAGILADNDEQSLYEAMKDALTHPEKLAVCRENIGKKTDLRYADRLKAVVDFFENV